jgi:galactokinase
MDQTIVVRGRRGHAVLLDCRDLKVKQIPIRLKGWSFAIFDTGVRHELAASEYNRRRAECARAAKRFKVGSVRETTLDHLLSKGDRLNASERKRVRHVLSEDLRTQQFAAELGEGDVFALGRFLYGSHASLRDDYQVSCRELDFLVEALREQRLQRAVAGARMTGGGFGGSVVALIRARAFKSVHAALQRRYRKAMGRTLGVSLLVRPSAGARIEAL